jgi:hypothetical protein
MALEYAKAGIYVFPVSGTDRKPKSDKPNSEKLAKKPCYGVKWSDESTTDSRTIIEWWLKWPNALIGIDMGKSGLVGIDADRHDESKDGVEALKNLEVENDVLPDRSITLTANNGEHNFFGKPQGEPIGNSSGALPPGIDVRGAGGYVIAPGSITGADGEWLQADDTPNLIESFKAGTIPVLPDWLAAIIRSPKDRTERETSPAAPEQRTAASHQVSTRQRAWAQKALDANCRELAGMSEGGRNNALNAIGYRMGRMIARDWIERSTVESALEDACKRNGLLSEDGRRSVLATIKSGIGDGMGVPIGDLTDRERPAAAPQPDYGVRFEPDGTMIDAETGEVLEGLPPGFIEEDTKIPEAMFLIKGLLPRSEVFFIGGQSGAGKSFIAVHMALCLASTKPFFGRKVKEQIGSVFLVAEGSAGFQRRLRLARGKLGCKSKQPVSYLGSPPDLSSDAEIDALIPRLRAVDRFYQQTYGMRLGVVFVDTVAAAFSLEEENSNSEAAEIIKRMQRISRELDALIVPIHHYGKSVTTGLRGASAWRAGADGVLAVLTDDNGSGKITNRWLDLTKSRDSETGLIAPFELRTELVGKDSDGDEITSCWIEPLLDRHHTIAGKAKPEPKRVTVFREAFAELTLTDYRPHCGGPIDQGREGS